MKPLRVGLVQHHCTPDRQENIEKSIAGLRQAASQGARLAVLQELHCGPYFCQTEAPECFDLAEPIPGPTTEIFAALAKELHLVIVLSLFERRAAAAQRFETRSAEQQRR